MSPMQMHKRFVRSTRRLFSSSGRDGAGRGWGGWDRIGRGGKGRAKRGAQAGERPGLLVGGGWAAERLGERRPAADRRLSGQPARQAGDLVVGKVSWGLFAKYLLFYLLIYLLNSFPLFANHFFLF